MCKKSRSHSFPGQSLLLSTTVPNGKRDFYNYDLAKQNDLITDNFSLVRTTKNLVIVANSFNFSLRQYFTGYISWRKWWWCNYTARIWNAVCPSTWNDTHCIFSLINNTHIVTFNCVVQYVFLCYTRCCSGCIQFSSQLFLCYSYTLL